MAMYTIEELKELIQTVDNSSVTQFKIKDGTGQSVVISKKEDVTYVTPQYVQTEVMQSSNAVSLPQSAVATPQANEIPTEKAPQVDNSIIIQSPMVGVFYSKPAPDATPYVTVGSRVNKGDVICIVEAMKLMNEITATHSGTVEEICVEDGDVVAFDQPLFKLK